MLLTTADRRKHGPEPKPRGTAVTKKERAQQAKRSCSFKAQIFRYLRFRVNVAVPRQAEACRPGFTSCLGGVRSLFGPLCVIMCRIGSYRLLRFVLQQITKARSSRTYLWEPVEYQRKLSGTPAENNGRITLVDRSRIDCTVHARRGMQASETTAWPGSLVRS